MNPAWISIDASLGSDCTNPLDRVRGFYSMHASGANFSYGDSSTRFISTSVDVVVFRSLSTLNGGEIVSDDY